VFSYCLTIILILEALSLLIALGRNGRSIKRTLKPLQALTASAQALTAKGGRLSPEALKRLTGALDSINVSHLDTGLPLAGISDELKPLAEAINEMLARIDEAYHSQVRFVSDASHELRTPIAVIQGYANLLTRWGTEDPETMRESIQAIRQEADAMKEMVEQLLFLARGDNDSMHLDWKEVDLSALAAEVLREIEIIDGSHCFSSTIAPAVTVDGDDGLLKQLMRILVDNSMKYTAPGGQILLRIEQRPGQAAIVVQDEGAGIPEEAMPHIFDRFFRADESRTRNTGGTGLGLSIAKWIAQRHNGLIEVVSRENIGTRMTVLLPIATRR
jgi:signal transduction histidine kinase